MDLLSKQKYQRGVQWLIGLGVILGLGAIATPLYLSRLNSGSSPVVRVLTVTQGRVENPINESGTVIFGNQQTLKAPDDSTVERVLVKVGDRVGFGQQLLMLRNPEREINIANQQSQIQGKQLEIDRYQQEILSLNQQIQDLEQEQRGLAESTATGRYAGTALFSQIQEKEITLERDRQKILEAEITVQEEQKQLEQLQRLNQRGFIAGNDLRSQENQLRNAQSNLKDAQLRVTTGTLELQRLRRGRLKELQTQLLDLDTKRQMSQLTLQNAQLEQQRLQRDLIKFQQQALNFVVSAPIGGQVLSINVNNGDGVKRADNLLTLGDPTQEWVELRLSTLDAVKVRLDQPVRVSIIGPNPKPFTGRVQMLSPIAVKDEANSNIRRSGAAQPTVAAMVQLDQPTGELIPGSQVSVTIILEERQNVITLRPEAIARTEEKPFVWVLNAQNQVEKREISLGLEGLAEVEVSSGLKKGDRVVLPSPELTLTPGMSVTVQPSSPAEAEKERR